jgi:hypothetical protein
MIGKRFKKFKKMPLTPITVETFNSQGWEKVTEVEDANGDEYIDFYYRLHIPKFRNDEYTMMLVSNSESERYSMQDMGIKSNEFLVNIENSDGLGVCKYAE